MTERCGARARRGWALGVVAALAAVVALAGCGRDSGTGTAAPTTASAAPVELVAVGDIACAPGSPVTQSACRQADTADLAREIGPDAVLLLGDIQYDAGTVQQYAGSGGWTGSWDGFLDRTWPTAGNHEWRTTGAEGYDEAFRTRTRGRHWYSADLGAWHVVSLDSECSQVGGCGEGSPQHDWLLRDLDEHDGVPTLVFWHRPRWTTGMHGPAADVDPLWRAAAEDDDVQLVLGGHDHDYERFPPLDADGRPSADGPRSFVVGTGGKGLRCERTDEPNPASEAFDCSSLGVLRLLLRSDGYDWQFVPAVGSFTDAGSSGLR